MFFFSFYRQSSDKFLKNMFTLVLTYFSNIEAEIFTFSNNECWLTFFSNGLQELGALFITHTQKNGNV